VKVVIDTNVIVSAALSDRDPEAVILFIVRTPGIQWIATAEIVDEYVEVLSRPKFGLASDLRHYWRSLFEGDLTIVHSTPPVEFARDRKDAKFIGLALSTGADFLITGDRDFEDAEKLMETTVVSVSQFKHLFEISR
jgi:uncharacterized protein